MNMPVSYFSVPKNCFIKHKKVYHVFICPYFVPMVLSWKLRVSHHLSTRWHLCIIISHTNLKQFLCLIHKYDVGVLVWTFLRLGKWNRRPTKYKLLWCICKSMVEEYSKLFHSHYFLVISVSSPVSIYIFLP